MAEMRDNVAEELAGVSETHLHDAKTVAKYGDLPVNPKVEISSTADDSEDSED